MLIKSLGKFTLFSHFVQVYIYIYIYIYTYIYTYIYIYVAAIFCVQLSKKHSHNIYNSSYFIIKPKVSTFPNLDTFFRGCVAGVVLPSYAVGFIYILGKLSFVSFITV